MINIKRQTTSMQAYDMTLVLFCRKKWSMLQSLCRRSPAVCRRVAGQITRTLKKETPAQSSAASVAESDAKDQQGMRSSVLGCCCFACVFAHWGSKTTCTFTLNECCLFFISGNGELRPLYLDVQATTPLVSLNHNRLVQRPIQDKENRDVS